MAYGTETGLECTAPLGDCQVWQRTMCAEGREGEVDQLASPVYSTDDFRMYCFKVTPCDKMFSHDWTLCPFAHPREKARRRDPQRANYAAIACIDMKKNGTCPRGDRCPYAHNVFEYWMHPTRYRTQICKDGPACDRSICFFAHRLEELRVPPHKPGFPPECRRRRHGRGGSSNTAKKDLSAFNAKGTGGQGTQPLARRALSVPAAVACDISGLGKMQMSDGTWGSPGRHAPRVAPASCSSPVDPFGSSPITPLSPTIWSPRPLASPFTQPGAFPTSGGSSLRQSLDSEPITEQGDEDVARVLLQLMDSLSLTSQQAGGTGGAVQGMPAGARSRSLDSHQFKALQLAVVERALSARDPLDVQSARSAREDFSPRCGQAPRCKPQLGMVSTRGVANMGDGPTEFKFDSNPGVQGHQAPFPTMSRDVAMPPGLLLEGWNSGGDLEKSAVVDRLQQAYGLRPQISGVSL